MSITAYYFDIEDTNDVIHVSYYPYNGDTDVVYEIFTDKDGKDNRCLRKGKLALSFDLIHYLACKTEKFWYVNNFIRNILKEEGEL